MEKKMILLEENGLERLEKKVDELYQYLIGNNKSSVEWIPSSQVMKELQISSKTWQIYRDERRIPFSQFGRKIYVKRSDLDKFLEEHRITR